MAKTTSNPCAACTIDQDCCRRLTGLRLTQIEFDRCFAEHENDLIIQREGLVFVVSQRAGGACPNWRDGGCAVYDGRPRECELFPFTMYSQVGSAAVTVRLHSDTQCPLKTELLSDVNRAEQLARDFATEAFGESRSFSIRHENRLERITRTIRHTLRHWLAKLF